MKILPSLLLLLSGAVPAGAITLADALARVEAGHPAIRTRDAARSLAGARIEAAAASPSPILSLSLENAPGTGELRGARQLETTLQFSRALDWHERRSARRDAAAARGEADRLAWEERRLAVLAETARRFIRVATAQADLDAARRHADLARAARDDVAARAARAAATPADVARARLALAEAEIEAEHVEHLLLAARHALASLWGAKSPDFERAEADLTDLPEAASFEVLAARLSGGVAQARHAAVVRWRQAQERLAHAAGARGEPRWAAGLRRLEESDAFALVLGLDYAWPARRAAQADATEARAEQELAAADGAAALLEARAELFALTQELNHARIEHEAARDEMLPAARAWLDSIGQAAAGRYGVKDQFEARAAVLNATRRQNAAAGDYHLTLVAIEHLLGSPATP